MYYLGPSLYAITNDHDIITSVLYCNFALDKNYHGINIASKPIKIKDSNKGATNSKLTIDYVWNEPSTLYSKEL